MVVKSYLVPLSHPLLEGRDSRDILKYVANPTLSELDRYAHAVRRGLVVNNRHQAIPVGEAIGPDFLRACSRMRITVDSDEYGIYR